MGAPAPAPAPTAAPDARLVSARDLLPVSASSAPRSPWVSLLLRRGGLHPAGVAKAKRRQAVYGGCLDTSLLELALVEEDALIRALHDGTGLLPPPKGWMEDPDSEAATLMPLAQARRMGAQPLRRQGTEMRLVVHPEAQLDAAAAWAAKKGCGTAFHLVAEVHFEALLSAVHCAPLPPRFAVLLGRLWGPARVRARISTDNPARRKSSAPPVETGPLPERPGRSQKTGRFKAQAVPAAATAAPEPQALAPEPDVLADENPARADTVALEAVPLEAVPLEAVPLEAVPLEAVALEIAPEATEQTAAETSPAEQAAAETEFAETSDAVTRFAAAAETPQAAETPPAEPAAGEVEFAELIKTYAAEAMVLGAKSEPSHPDAGDGSAGAPFTVEDAVEVQIVRGPETPLHTDAAEAPPASEAEDPIIVDEEPAVEAHREMETTPGYSSPSATGELETLLDTARALGLERAAEDEALLVALRPHLNDPRVEAVIDPWRQAALDWTGRRGPAANATLAALCTLRDTTLVGPLIERLADAGAERASVLAALRTLTRHDFGETHTRWARWWRDHGHEHRVEWLLAALDGKNPELRLEAARELEAVSGKYVGYHFDLGRREREEAKRRWRRWWLETGKSKSA